MSAHPASGEREERPAQAQGQQALAARAVFGEKMYKLVLKLVINAAKGDKDKTLEIARKIMELFEETLEEEKEGVKG